MIRRETVVIFDYSKALNCISPDTPPLDTRRTTGHNPSWHIKNGEVWVGDCFVDEFHFLHKIDILTEGTTGPSYERAIEKINKSLRSPRRMALTNDYSIQTYTTAKEVKKFLRKELEALREIGYPVDALLRQKTNIAVVNGEIIRTEKHCGWSQGGNSKAYPEINPPGWVMADGKMSLPDIRMVAVHEELEEFQIAKMGDYFRHRHGRRIRLYDAGHRHASGIETQLRMMLYGAIYPGDDPPNGQVDIRESVILERVPITKFGPYTVGKTSFIK